MAKKWKDIEGYRGAYQVSSLGGLRNCTNGARRKVVKKLLGGDTGYSNRGVPFPEECKQKISGSTYQNPDKRKELI